MDLEELFHLEAGLGGDAFEALAALADHHRLVGVAVDDDGRVDAAQAGSASNFSILDGHAVGQLLAELAEQLLAQELGRQKALAAVGDVVGAEDRLAFGQVGLAAFSSWAVLPALLGAHMGTISAKG